MTSTLNDTQREAWDAYCAALARLAAHRDHAWRDDPSVCAWGIRCPCGGVLPSGLPSCLRASEKLARCPACVRRDHLLPKVLERLAKDAGDITPAQAFAAMRGPIVNMPARAASATQKGEPTRAEALARLLRIEAQISRAPPEEREALKVLLAQAKQRVAAMPRAA